MSEVAVIGAGAWGRALALHAARAGREVTLWARDPARVDLPGIRVTADMPAATRLLLLAVPVQHMRAVAARLPRGPVLGCGKGLEAGTLRLPLEILAALSPDRPVGVLSGPNFAAEIAAGLPAAAVVASTDAGLRAAAIATLGTPGFRLYGSDDPIGAQIGGAAKNVIAIAAGIVIGAGLGENARAALVTRGLAELIRLAVALGGRGATLAGLSGLGDLLLTCTGPASRNFSLGQALGQGRPLAAILEGRRDVTEGVATAPALVARATEAGAAMPICAAVAAVLGGQQTIAQAAATLQGRPARDEGG